MFNAVHKTRSPEKGLTGHEKISSPHKFPFRLKTSVWCWKAAASFFPQLRRWTTSLWQIQVSVKHTIPFIKWDLVQRSPNDGNSGNKCLMVNIQGKHMNVSECLEGPDFLFYFCLGGLLRDIFVVGMKVQILKGVLILCVWNKRHKLKYLFNDISIIWNKRVT